MDKIYDYVTTLIIFIMAMTLIEMLLSNNKNKKYVMFAGTLIVLINVLNPIIKAFGSNIDLTEKIREIEAEMNQIEVSKKSEYQMENQLQDTYENLLINNIKERLEEIGYTVLDVDVVINKSTYEPEKIEMKIRYKDGFIQPIVIDVFGSIEDETILKEDSVKIKNILSQTYGVEEKNIIVNGK